MLPTRVFLPPIVLVLASATSKVSVVILYSTGSCGAAICYGYDGDDVLLLGLVFDLLVLFHPGAGVLVASREQLGSVSSTGRTPLKGDEYRDFAFPFSLSHVIAFVRPRRSICLLICLNCFSASPSAPLLNRPANMKCSLHMLDGC